ncbi:T9SS type A sorting domain-containing protein [Pontibacter qinzhouensis]|uniref:T9SS type A sorting domain-containing protein n=1 Tax=Pontibacter qinzhouensis TaxID=2603253 RepID=A0A5C8KFR8_9BACT|nr:T9SS type A sorting domain-containing protein [Pontibacter qinzhouensis]TXK52902.1 T9SS type A sorting domain-containing protein [Pontibacter qinzhouensis]
MKTILRFLFLLIFVTGSVQAYAQGNVYIRTNTCGAFWELSGNEVAMDAVFGAGNWQQQHFETTDPATLFSASNEFIFIEGSNCGTEEMLEFLDANRPAMEAWVKNGGKLLVNAAPSEGPYALTIGFDDVQLMWAEDGSYGFYGEKANASHSIFRGPLKTVANDWTGSAFSHHKVLGTGLTNIIKDLESDEVYLAEKQWGAGTVIIGGLTLTFFQGHYEDWAPAEDVANVHKNLLTYLGTNDLQFAPAGTISYCHGSELTVPFNAIGFYKPGTTFALQLSDATGSFAAPVTLTTFTDANVAEIKATVPASIPAGAGYKLRVVVGDYGLVSAAADMVINALPTFTFSKTDVSCVGGSNGTITINSIAGYLCALNGGAYSTKNVFNGLTAGTYTLQVKAATGCESVAQTVTIGTTPDTILPTIVAPAAVTLSGTTGACGAVTVALGTPVVNDNCEIGSVKNNAPATFPAGTTTVTWTVTDKAGNKATATQQVTVTGVSSALAVSVSGGAGANTIVLGYESQSVSLTAAAGAGNYVWSGAAGLSKTAGATTVFTPTAAGVYTIQVTATTAQGCPVAGAVTITVVDARCGNKNDKVLVCHNGQEICIAASAVKAHLAHGCSVGPCGAKAAIASASNQKKAQVLQAEDNSLVAYPNPFGESTRISFTLKEAGDYRLELFDAKGVLVNTLAAGEGMAGATHAYQLSGSKLVKGIYIARFVTAGEVKTIKIVLDK